MWFYQVEKLVIIDTDLRQFNSINYSWSWFYDYSYKYLRDNLFTIKYYIKLLINLFILFIIFKILLFYQFDLNENLYWKLFAFRYLLLLIVIIYSAYIFKKYLNKFNKEGHAKVDNYYLKFIMFFWYLGSRLNVLIVRYCNLFLNLSLLYYLFELTTISKLLTYFKLTAVSKLIIFLKFTTYYQLLPYLVLSYIIVYFIYLLILIILKNLNIKESNPLYFLLKEENKLESILFLPTVTILCYLIYGGIWWIWFVLSCLLNGYRFYMKAYIANYFYKGPKRLYYLPIYYFDLKFVSKYYIQYSFSNRSLSTKFNKYELERIKKYYDEKCMPFLEKKMKFLDWSRF